MKITAGSRRVIELHGSLAMVRCVECMNTMRRVDFQKRLLALNEGWANCLHADQTTSAPDGDADLENGALAGFRVPQCTCGKPIGVINLGPTRADEVAALKAEAGIGDAMPELVVALNQ
jgi:NAD-dependent SIR2 family protein deacetylase